MMATTGEVRCRFRPLFCFSSEKLTQANSQCANCSSPRKLSDSSPARNSPLVRFTNPNSLDVPRRGQKRKWYVGHQRIDLILDAEQLTVNSTWENRK